MSPPGADPAMTAPVGSPWTSVRGLAAGEDLTRLAYHDPLTELPNRARLAAHLDGALQRAGTEGAVILISIDLDDFKLVNDGLGHAAGDELLRQLAQRLDRVRRPEDLLARQGGDEFLLVVEPAPGADPARAAAAIGRRIAAALDEPFLVADAELRIGASVGAALHPHDARDAETLQRHADSAMYQAKEKGGGFSLYRPGGPDPLARLSLASALRRGLRDDALEVHYQPVFRLPERGLLGVEALILWRDETGAMIPSAEFIPVAEKTGIIHTLGHQMLERVCADAAAWARRGLCPNIGINISPAQLQRPDFPAEFNAVVRAHGIDPRRIVLELTESAWTLEAGRIIRGLERLTHAGFTLALDDFGAGYSSLARLRRLPVGVIKIDRSFLEDLPDDPQAAAIIEAILALATACDCDVVCGGVETEAQLRFLSERGCRLAQGSCLAHPQPLAAITDLLSAELVEARRA
jgi:diguanylate cyclase (GGDEF)-like protein